MTFICCLAVSCLSLASCDSELDVQQEYPFTVESMPVVGKIADGETDASQTIDLYFEDNWGNLQRLSYDFNADDTPLAEKDDTHGKEVQP